MKLPAGPNARRSLPNLHKNSKRSSMLMLTPIQAMSDEQTEKSESESSSLIDEESKLQYQKGSSYKSLPPHVKGAIDKVKAKNKHSDFYDKLKSLNTKIRVYKQIFYTKAPAYESRFYEKRR